jgi:hypothetical protein
MSSFACIIISLLSKITEYYLIGGLKIMSILENWQQWKDFLGDRLNQAEDQGVSGNTINELAYQVGDYLAQQVDPKNEQERVLSDLWSVASPEEQHAIANIMVKLVQNNGTNK